MHRHEKDGSSAAAAEISRILRDIPPGAANRTGHIFLNAIHNEFMTLDGTITVPRIPVKELDMATSLDLVRGLAPFIPGFFRDHVLLEQRNPPAEQHHLHFVRKIRGRVVDFTHIFKLDFKFGGDPSSIVERGNSDWYPSYTTNRIYYKSRLIPENSVHRHEESTAIRPVRIREADEVESDQFFHTFAIFDELDSRGLTKELLEKLDRDIFSISTETYSFIVYDYFTACMNVLYPDSAGIAGAAEIFEPLFLCLYSRFRNVRGLVNIGAILEHFGEYIAADGQGLAMTDALKEKLKSYFARFSISRDDDMMVKGWWRFNSTPPPQTSPVKTEGER